MTWLKWLFYSCKVDGPCQTNLVLIAYASSEGSGEPAHPRSLARTFAARSYKQWVKRNLQRESQIPGSSEWLGMRSWNWSWRNARRHKFAWRGPDEPIKVCHLKRISCFTNLCCGGLEDYVTPARVKVKALYISFNTCSFNTCLQELKYQYTTEIKKNK